MRESHNIARVYRGGEGDGGGGDIEEKLGSEEG